jgi:dihydrofolate synthase / folylpolyglutamate synthase
VRMEFTEAAAWILARTNHEVVALDGASAARLELRPLRALLGRLGDPQRGRGGVHLTGSNGKGSTAAMIAAMLRGAGARTGLFTSPHLHTIRERIQIDGEPIDEATFAALTDEIRPHAEAIEREVGPLTVFELLTALGFLAFRAAGCDWQVIEVGLGGTLDATNALDEKQVCVFTPIDLEHTAILGNTVAQIATDKAGILRPGVRAVMALQREPAAEALRAACAGLNAPLAEVALSCALRRERVSLDGQELKVRTPRATYAFTLPLLGRFQSENAATALLAVDQLAETEPRIEVTPQIAAAALREVRWPGRVEVLRRTPLVVVDGAHTPDAVRQLVRAVQEELKPRSVRLVLGVSRDKKLATLAQAFSVLKPDVIAVAAAHPRAVPPEEISAAFQALDLPARAAPNVAAGVDAALAEAAAGDLVLVAGSLFVVAEARAAVLGLLPSPA